MSLIAANAPIIYGGRRMEFSRDLRMMMPIQRGENTVRCHSISYRVICDGVLTPVLNFINIKSNGGNPGVEESMLYITSLCKAVCLTNILEGAINNALEALRRNITQLAGAGWRDPNRLNEMYAKII